MTGLSSYRLYANIDRVLELLRPHVVHNHGLVFSFLDELLSAVGRNAIHGENAEHFFAELYPMLFDQARDMSPEQIAALYAHAVARNASSDSDRLVQALMGRAFLAWDSSALVALTTILRTALSNGIALEGESYRHATIAILDMAIKQEVGQEPRNPDWKRPRRGCQSRSYCSHCEDIDDFLQSGQQSSFKAYLSKKSIDHVKDQLSHSRDGHRYQVTTKPPDSRSRDRLLSDNMCRRFKDKQKEQPYMVKWTLEVTKTTVAFDAEHKAWSSRAIAFQRTVQSMVPDEMMRLLLGSRYDELMQLRAVKTATAHLFSHHNMASHTLPPTNGSAQVFPAGMSCEQVKAMFEVSLQPRR